MRISMIKKEAKELLRGLNQKYLLFVVPIILSIFYYGISIHESIATSNGIDVPISASSFPLLILGILTIFGCSASFTILDVFRHKKTQVNFDDTSKAWKSPLFLKLILVLLLRLLVITLWAMIWMSGLFIIIWGFLLFQQAGHQLTVSVLLVILAGVILYVLELAIVINRRYAYRMVPFILYDHFEDNQDHKPSQILKESNALMKHYKWKLFIFDLSFIGYFILVFLTFGFALFYVLPYQLTAETNFYRYLNEKIIKVFALIIFFRLIDTLDKYHRPQLEF
ncbi:hypothetical protein HMPREF9318_00999 [Streptococcus urinalis FB127-CNA-2]|uniref:Membrane protein n=1 Tax=Streptococcus urinalis 2285-97 TaxID=764291 RepID=G5KH64_9STRE|nr:DUF975 family protein [Streptococcus urinalis]EHJ57380.1 putative membrane protein [Streptococcus urinalis 2285-97]EKS21045.1 hypothetical protein HMPREF9318_00999 [Streptococcus urinalis FB127-CNA-2]VEF31054.1 membrane protein [Streptococcus urinalis]